MANKRNIATFYTSHPSLRRISHIRDLGWTSSFGRSTDCDRAIVAATRKLLDLSQRLYGADIYDEPTSWRVQGQRIATLRFNIHGQLVITKESK